MMDSIEFYNNQFRSDFKIISGAEEIPVHSFMLCIKSGFFVEYFKNNIDKKFANKDAYYVKDIESAKFILMSMYGKKVNTTFTHPKQLIEYIILSDIWQIPINIKYVKQTIHRFIHLIDEKFIMNISVYKLPINGYLIRQLMASNRESLISPELVHNIPVSWFIESYNYIKCMRIACYLNNKDYVVGVLEHYTVAKFIEFINTYNTELFNDTFISEIQKLDKPRRYKFITFGDVVFVYDRYNTCRRSGTTIILPKSMPNIKGLMHAKLGIFQPIDMLDFNKTTEIKHDELFRHTPPKDIIMCEYVLPLWRE